jgi:signal transduction histidine kinase
LSAEYERPEFRVEVKMSGDFEAIPSGLEQSIYRIVQEALTNVVKHTHGANTRVTISATPDRILLEVLNAAGVADGSPARANGTANNGHSDVNDHHGIIGMKERAMAFGGSLAASSLPDGGFRVSAELPFRDGK